MGSVVIRSKHLCTDFSY